MAVTTKGRFGGQSQPVQFQEGDRCTGCGHWWWDERELELGGWHSLVPISFADTKDLARTVQCGVCPQTAGRPGVWV